MKQFPTVEDYLEIIAGYKDFNGQAKQYLFMPDPSINLARYDVSVVGKMAETTATGHPLSDGQGPLACKIIIKYKKQLAQHGVDIAPIETNPSFRRSLRKIDREEKVWVEGNYLYMKFPYNAERITQLRGWVNEGQGHVEFNRDLRLWVFNLTEANVNWAYTFAETQKFQIDSSVQILMDKILEAEKNNFEIKLTKENNTYTIINAEKNLIEYVDTHVGFDDGIALVDASVNLCYTVDDSLLDQLVTDSSIKKFFQVKEIKIGTDLEELSPVFEYARTTNRYPIYIYQPNLVDIKHSKIEELVSKYFTASEIFKLGNNKLVDNVPEDVKVIFTHKLTKQTPKQIPMLITFAGLIYGGDKSLWLQKAERIVYSCHEVYSKKK